jgi:cytoskeletal protein RodZ
MPTLGEQLRAAREARKLKIGQVVQATRIRSYYLEAIEADDLSMLPSAVQARGFLRAYAEFLGLNLAELLENASPTPKKTPEPQPEPTPPPVSLPTPPQEPVQATEAIPAPPSSPRPSDLIFRKIGIGLKQRRELLSLTLDEIERHTHIRAKNLDAIENGDFDLLPSPVQARGMLNTYATFLDINGETMLLNFAEGLQARRIERQQEIGQKPVKPRRKLMMPLWLGRLISADLIFGSLMLGGLSLLLLWGASRIVAAQELEQEAQAPSISDILLAPPSLQAAEAAEALPTSLEIPGTLLPSLDAEPTSTAEPPTALPGTLLQVTLLVRERAFVRVIVDGEIKLEGRIAPGAALVFDGNERIEVLTGSGNAIQLIYNQFDYGLMGNPGEVVNRIYTLDGIQTPTPTISPTATNTPRITASPSPSLTPLPNIDTP